jgi:hypothetical protein
VQICLQNKLLTGFSQISEDLQRMLWWYGASECCLAKLSGCYPPKLYLHVSLTLKDQEVELLEVSHYLFGKLEKTVLALFIY